MSRRPILDGNHTVKNRKLDVKYIDKDGGTEEQGEINVFPEGDERGDHIFYAVLLCRIVT